jgi:hypothetical protein
MSKQETIRIEFTKQQQETIKKVTGKAPRGLELTAQELEERVAPLMFE